MVADGLFVGGDVNAVDFVLGDLALDPLDAGAHVAEDTARLLRDGLEVGSGEVARVGDVAFDNVLRHELDCIS